MYFQVFVFLIGLVLFADRWLRSADDWGDGRIGRNSVLLLCRLCLKMTSLEPDGSARVPDILASLFVQREEEKMIIHVSNSHSKIHFFTQTNQEKTVCCMIRRSVTRQLQKTRGKVCLDL